MALLDQFGTKVLEARSFSWWHVLLVWFTGHEYIKEYIVAIVESSLGEFKLITNIEIYKIQYIHINVSIDVDVDQVLFVV